MKTEYTDKTMNEKLLELFPDANVIETNVDDDLFKEIQRLGNKEGYNTKDYLMHLGFNVNGISVQDRLAILYPDKNIVNLSSKDKILYKICMANAIRLRILLDNYFKDMGFIYNPESFDVIKSVPESNKCSKRGRKYKLISILEQKYPKKIIKSIKSSDPIYKDIYLKSKAQNMSFKEYLASIGFEYQGLSPEEKLLELYPNKNVYKLKDNHPELYSIFKKAARNDSMAVDKYLKNIGFNYKSKTNELDNNDIFNILSIEYPNKSITGLYKNNASLYKHLCKTAKKQNTNVKSYLEGLGFNYVSNLEEKEHMIKQRLTELYPNKTIKVLIKKDASTYSKIVQCAHKKGITVKEFVNGLGFQYNAERKSVTKNRISEEKKTMLDAFLKSKGVKI